MGFWKGKKVLVTGGAGFLGTHVVELLRRHEAQVFVTRSVKFDLAIADVVENLCYAESPEVVIHLAAACGSVADQADRPGEFLYTNIVMGAHILDAARRHNVTRVVQVGTATSYPRTAPLPWQETDLFSGEPCDPFQAAGKVPLLVMARAYREQYGLRTATLILSNLYGPGDARRMVPQLAQKFLDAKQKGNKAITAWGTGLATRDLLYVEDAAMAVLHAIEVDPGPDPVNVGSGEEISVRDIADRLGVLCGFAGEVRWDSSKPEGLKRMCLDIKRARQIIGWEPSTSLDTGLTATVDWLKTRSYISK